MAKIGPPQDTTATNRIVGGKIIPLTVVKPGVQKPENKAETGGSSSSFDPSISREVPRPEATTGAVASPVKARFTAFGLEGGLPIKQAPKAARITETEIGKVLDGSVVVESARALQKLEGVVRITGNLTLQEAHLTGGEVTPVNSLLEIDGRLTIEGVH